MFHSGIIFEQLEERIVLDGAVDDMFNRAELFSAQTKDTDSGFHNDLESHVAVSTDAAQSHVVDPLALETGTEWLQDGTWHYWQKDWGGDGNGYEFHAWQDGSSSFHQIQWDAALNSKGTHNGFDYNLQRDGSWTYQTIQWDANQNGYSYNSASAGTYAYYSQQWSNGLGYDYSSDNAGKWTYRTVSAGSNEGERAYYLADSTGWWDFTYTWPNGVLWHDAADDYGWHVVNDTWSYRRGYHWASELQQLQEAGLWKLNTDTEARFEYNYVTKTWCMSPKGDFLNIFYTIGTATDPAFIGDGTFHDLNAEWCGKAMEHQKELPC